LRKECEGLTAQVNEVKQEKISLQTQIEEKAKLEETGEARDIMPDLQALDRKIKQHFEKLNSIEGQLAPLKDLLSSYKDSAALTQKFEKLLKTLLEELPQI
jgi:chromosome segregation ATPase